MRKRAKAKGPKVAPRFCSGGCARDLNLLELSELANGSTCQECADEHEAREAAPPPPPRPKPPKATAEEVAVVVATIEAPEGWTREALVGKGATGSPYHDRAWESSGVTTVLLRGPGLVLALRVGPCDWKGAWEIDGTTNFETPRGWSSFDRTGVESSFTVSPENTYGYATVAAAIAGERERVAKYLEADAKRVTIPGLGYRTTPEGVEEHKKRLAAGKAVEFTPSGFGTGYRLIVRPRWRDTPKAKPETAAFYGFDVLYLESFDHD